MATRLRLILPRLLLAGASLVAGLATAEIVMRLLGYHGPTYLRLQNITQVDDPALNWRFTPNNVFHFNNVEYRINELGFRDVSRPLTKPEGVFRILLGSDSIGYGVNVQARDSYPKVLEKLLNERLGPRRFEVVNLSMPGLSLGQKLHLVERHAPHFDPDLVVIDYCMNDPAGDMIWRPPKARKGPCTIAILSLRVPCFLEDLARRSAFLFAIRQALEEAMLAHGKEVEDRDYRDVTGSFYLDLYENPATRAYLDETLSRIHEFEQTHDVRVFMPLFPILHGLDEYKWAGVDSLLQDACASHHIAHVSLLKAFSGRPDRAMRVQRGDFLHPSVEGHRLAAETILESLVSRGWVGAAARPRASSERGSTGR